MYDAEINTALNDASQFLRDSIISGGETPTPNRAKPFVKQALQLLVGDLEATCGIQGTRGMLPVLLASNFLMRAAVDLYGPGLCAAMQSERGEWGIVDNISSGRVGSTAWSLARGLLGTVTTLAETATDRVWALIKRVVAGHVQFGSDMLCRIQRDRSLLNRAFGITGTLNGLTVTGSDPHRTGHRVVLLRFSDGRRTVYKPSDLTFQLLLMGDPTSFQVCHAHHPKLFPHTDSLFTALDPDLPAIRIVAMPHKRGEYGYMQMVAKANVIALVDQGTYFRKLGRLITVAALFGITDLHEENVMATDDGPYLIDAEMGFSYPGQGVGPIDHSSLNRVLHITPQQYTNVGGVFSPAFDNQGAWEISKLSAPYDPTEINAGFRTGAHGPWVGGATYPNVLLQGIREEVDRIALRLPNIHRWIGLMYSVAPVARVILSTTVMCSLHVNGVTRYLQGNLETDAQAPHLSFDNWLRWYGGKHNAVPGALFQPHSRQVLYDPTGTLGVTYGTATAGGVSVAHLTEVWNEMNRLSTAQGVTNLKARLKTALEANLGCGPLV
ncbi:DUF4135 domain-containing protein [Corallococcus sicarius]|uniref:DUF4135 domain-containing protein n=1 Tax=Corallococcus sicarius TaxID=2316726 RepID=A0A3A8NLH8_9BACT|nr:DUF4135 domain-containing protein [Corallococcus sicarius]RKH44220.1 DUF4135 domain-containing protein [Corallococcus sicarius]